MVEIADRMKKVSAKGWTEMSLEERIKSSGLSSEVIERTLSYL
jgi:hypothetical protein